MLLWSILSSLRCLLMFINGLWHGFKIGLVRLRCWHLFQNSTHWLSRSSVFPTGNFFSWLETIWLDNLLICTSDKIPDALLYPDRTKALADGPSIALEVGYSETMQDLQNDARVLLEGSKGKIKLVILVKIEPPLQPDDTTLHSGSLQLWRYDDKTKKAFDAKVSRNVSRLRFLKMLENILTAIDLPSSSSRLQTLSKYNTTKVGYYSTQSSAPFETSAPIRSRQTPGTSGWSCGYGCGEKETSEVEEVEEVSRSRRGGRWCTKYCLKMACSKRRLATLPVGWTWDIVFYNNLAFRFI